MTDVLRFQAAAADVYCDQAKGLASIVFVNVEGPGVDIILPVEELRKLRDRISRAIEE